MSTEDFEEQVNAYLLGDLSPAELAAFERALGTEGELRDFLREREQALEQLTLEIAPQVEPSAVVRERLLAAAAADLRAHPVQPKVDLASASAVLPRTNHLRPATPKVASWPAFVRPSLVGAAALAALAVGLGLWKLEDNMRRENESLRAQVRELAAANNVLHGAREESASLREICERLQGEVAALREQAEKNDRDSAALRQQLARVQEDLLAAQNQGFATHLQFGLLQPAAGGAPRPTVPVPKTAGGIALWDPQRQQGMLFVQNLPTLRPDQDYQVWVADPSQSQPVPSSVFHPARPLTQDTVRLVTNERIEHAIQFMVTLERKGGASRITGPAILASAPRR